MRSLVGKRQKRKVQRSQTHATTSRSSSLFKCTCESCDFETNSALGLSIHRGMTHKNDTSTENAKTMVEIGSTQNIFDFEKITLENELDQ